MQHVDCGAPYFFFGFHSCLVGWLVGRRRRRRRVPLKQTQHNGQIFLSGQKSRSRGGKVIGAQVYQCS